MPQSKQQVVKKKAPHAEKSSAAPAAAATAAVAPRKRERQPAPVALPRSKKSAVAAPQRTAASFNRRKLSIPVAEDEEDEDITFDDVDDDDEEDDDLLNDAAEGDDDNADFEQKAERFKQRMRKESVMAQQEQLQDIADRSAKTTMLQDLADEAEDGQKGQRVGRDGERMLLGVQPSHTTEELNDRIKETVRVLTHFAEEREAGHARDEYQDLLRTDLMTVYEYNSFLMDAVLDMFSPAEAVEFLEAMEQVRPTTIRTNTIKCKRRDLVQALTKKGVHVEPLEKWTKVGLQIFESNVPVAGTTEYLAGHYMLQSAVSFLPVMALQPMESERVLDMAAAPGGKTTYIAQLMKNSGVLFANDVSEPRCKSLNANLQRLGITNCIVTNYDGAGYDTVMKNFDRVLLDAPCTGTGIISRDKAIKLNKQREDVQRHGQLQRRLLLSAIDCCKKGGVVVYSTCSFMVDEDEAVVDYCLGQRDVVIEDMGLPFGRPGFVKFRHHRFHASLEHSRRYFPHVHNMDGFFVCRLRKVSDTRQAAAATTASHATAKPHQQATDATKKQPAQKHAAALPSAEVTKASLKISVPPKLIKASGKGAKKGAAAGPKKKAKKSAKKG